ncbi:MAG: hypothetical protein KA319_14415 [Ferruginibacter sp.]|nr:hypothetical protein [Ferruginibacter sp.]
MDIYKLNRSFWDFSFENPDLMKPIHSAIFFFAIEHCNRLGWKEKFGFPSQMVMEAIGVKNWRTYTAGLLDLVDFGFIKIIESSKNQYSANVIAIVKNTKANTKALDKALQKHSTKHSNSTVSIDKQLYNSTIIPNTILQEKEKISIKKNSGKLSDFNIQDAPPQILQSSLEAWTYATDVELRKKITIDHVKDKWLQFVATNKDSQQWYNSENEIYTHFKRWITKQKFEDGNTKQHNKGGGKVGVSEARTTALQNW